LFGFGKSKSVKVALGADTVAGLHPYRALDGDAARRTLEDARLVDFKSGLLDLAQEADRLTFLLKGSLQFQTTNGGMALLEARTPQAAFALPGPGQVNSTYATEPGTLVSLPRPRDGVASGAVPPASRLLEILNASEAEAYAAMRSDVASEPLDLPSLPDLALKIGRAIDNKDTDNDDVARLLNLDPTLATRVLRVVNSAAFGGVSKITSTQQAVSRLGRQKVRSLVYSCLLKSIFQIQSKTLTRAMHALWQHSAQVAATSFVLGRQTPGVDPEQVMLAGLVHDIGAVATIDAISRYPVLYGRAEVLDALTASLRVELGLLTLRSWGLEDEFGAVVRHAEDWHHAGTAVPDIVDVVILAQMHALIGTQRFATMPRIDQIPAYTKLTNGEMTPRQSLKLLEDAGNEVREVQTLIGGD
jgi:HD-like signal output (HDOD) protein